MIHIINRYNRQLYEDVLEDMYRLRHSIFVEEKKWEKLRKPDGRERDEFDTEDATYILKLAPDGTILGGMRLYPTTGRTQLNSLFHDTCVLATQPAGDEHYEWSRYFIADARYRSPQGKPVHMELYAGILEYAVAKEIVSLSGYIEVGTFIRSKRMPWDMVQLGIPSEYGGDEGEPVGYGLPTQLNVNATMLQQTKSLWRMISPILSLSLGTENLGAEAGYKAEAVIEVHEALSRRSAEEFDQLVQELQSLSHKEVSSSTLQSLLAENLQDDVSLAGTIQHVAKHGVPTPVNPQH